MTRNWWLALCGSAILNASLASLLFAAPPAGSVAQAPAATDTLPAPTQAPAKAAPTTQVITKTVMVPQMTYKTFTVPDVVCRPEVHQKTVQVCRLVPETTMATCRMCVLVPEQRRKTVTYTACRMTFEDVVSNVTVMVPHREVKQATRTVCKPVETQEMQTVCKDNGHWDTKSFVDCCGCTRTYQCWVPNIVTEQVAVTVWKSQLVEVPYSYEVVVCQPEVRQITQRVAKPVYETQNREIVCTVAVPKLVEKQVPRTNYKPVVENKVVNCTVMVPVKVERQVTVPVCTMVPKQVTYTVPVCQTCCP
jgi:hypothetical protein